MSAEVTSDEAVVGIYDDDAQHAIETLLEGHFPAEVARPAVELMVRLLQQEGLLHAANVHGVPDAVVQVLTSTGLAVRDQFGTLAVLPVSAWGVFRS